MSKRVDDNIRAIENKTMETMNEAMPRVTLTDAALKQVKKLLVEQNNPNVFLRIGVVGGGCSGMSYVLALDHEKTGEDRMFVQEDVPIHIDDKSLPFLAGVKLDYTRDLLSGGFKFHNPNAVRSCGCGNSFTAKK
jgi:iron-sulfur cluster assembly protein